MSQRFAWISRVKKLFTSPFFKAVATLLSGTTLAQIITITLSPVLTRIYDPRDFGEYAVYASAMTLIGAGATARYGQAIFMAKTKEDAGKLLSLCVGISAGLSILTLCGAFIYRSFASDPHTWAPFLALGLVAAGIIEAMTFWLSRHQEFKSIAILRVTVSLSCVAMQIIFGLAFSATGLSLIASQALSQLTIGIFLVFYIRRRDPLSLRVPMVHDTRRLLLAFKNFPLYTLPTDLISTFVAQIPVFFFTYYLTRDVLGYFSLTTRVLGVPLTFIAAAIAEVFRQRASAAYLERGECRRLFERTFFALGALSFIFFSGLWILGPYLFGRVFGSEWRESGVYAQILSFMFFCRFISSPLSYMYYIVGRQREDFCVSLLNGILTPLALYVGYSIEPSAANVLKAFAVSTSFIQLLYLVRSYQFSRGTFSA